MATTETIIRGTTPIVPETMTLSPFDQFNGRHYLPLYFVFKQPDPSLSEVIVSELKEGLARLITEIPFLTGNVMIEDESRDLLTLEIPENGGVLFKVRRMVDAEEGPVLDYEDLERNEFPADKFNPMVMSPGSFLPQEVSPCLEVQINIIRGGVVLVAHFHHSIVDGEGGTTIVCQWAKHVATASEGRVLPESELLPTEALDRTVLFPENDSRRQLCDFASFQDGRDLTQDGASCWNVGERMEMTNAIDRIPVKGVSWHFSKESLEQIQEMGKPRNSETPKATESSVLSAFIFRHYTLARQLELRGIEEVSYHYPVNIRSRIEPQLPPQYLGNAVVPSRTTFSLAEIRSSDEDTLYRLASAISSSVDGWTSDKVWELIGAMEAWPRVRDIERTMDLNCKSDLHITNIAGFGVLESYWGPKMGNIIAFRLPSMALMDGYGLIMPRWADGGLEVVLYTDVKTLEILKEDAAFTKYARFVYT